MGIEADTWLVSWRLLMAHCNLQIVPVKKKKNNNTNTTTNFFGYTRSKALGEN